MFLQHLLGSTAGWFSVNLIPVKKVDFTAKIFYTGDS